MVDQSFDILTQTSLNVIRGSPIQSMQAFGSGNVLEPNFKFISVPDRKSSGKIREIALM